MPTRTAGHGAARAEQRPSSVLELVGSDRAMSNVLSFLGPALPMKEYDDVDDEGQFSGGRLREALALGRVLPGVCVGRPIKLGPAGAALLAADACLGGLRFASGSSWSHVLDALKLNTGLRELDLHTSALKARDVALLCGALAVNVSLVDVDLSNCDLQGSGAGAIAVALIVTTSLQKLTLSSCKLEPGDVAVLAGALAANSSLRELDLGRSDDASYDDRGGNNVGEAGGRAMAAALETNSTLHALRMCNTHLGDAGGRAIGAALATNTGLSQLDLSGNGLGEASGCAMAAALATSSTLCKLALSSNGAFGGSGAVALFAALRSNHTLLELRLADSGLGHASGVALAGMVRGNSTMRVLRLSKNRLGRAENGSGSCSWAQVLAALKHNTGLHTLGLGHCGLSADDGQALAQALEQRRSGLLRKLELNGNPGIGDRSCGAIIAACLKPGSSVASLGGIGDYGATRGGQQAMRSLAKGLRQDNKLEVLDLYHINGVVGGESSWPKLFAALAVNTRVHTLSLCYCKLTGGDGQALASALEQRPAGLLRELKVSNNIALEDDACSAIIFACLKPGSALRKLEIDTSGAGLLVCLASCLRANHTLEKLQLWGLDAECNWSELFGALAVNSGLRTLRIYECALLEQRDIEALAAVLRTNRGIHELCIEHHDFDANWGEILAGGLATNTTLRKLHLQDIASELMTAVHAFCQLLQTNSTLSLLEIDADLGSDAANEALKQAGRASGCHIVLYSSEVIR